MGLPVVTGTARVGETLTVDTSDISDADGLDKVLFTYQWLADDTEIQEATGPSYTLAPADEGKTVTVRVRFTDDAGNEEELTSQPTQTVAPAHTAPEAPQQLVLSLHDTGALEANWETPANDGGSAITGYRVQWKAAAGSWDIPEDISEALTSETSLTLTGLTDGVEYAVRVIAANDVGDSVPSEEATGTPGKITPPELSSATVDGTTLTLTYNEALDEDSVPAAEAFTVSVDGNARAVEGVAVNGSRVTLTLASAATPDDPVTVSYAAPTDAAAFRILNTGGKAAASFSEQAVTYNQPDRERHTPHNTPATGTPAITGVLRVKETLEVDTSGIAYDDGLNNVSFNYQWLADDVDIEDTTSPAYVLTDADEGKTISVQVSFSDDAGNAETLISPVTDAVAPAPVWSATLTVADFESFSGYNAYIETGELAPTGFTLDQADYVVRSLGTGDGSLRFSLTEQVPDGLTLRVGAVEYTLENASHSTGEDPGNSEETLHHYSWDSDIPSWSAGDEVAVSLTLNNADDTGDQSANSPATGAPTITGTAQVGETLTADTSAIEDSDGLEDVSFTYQWLRDDAEIEEATGPSHTLTDADEGKAIKVMVSFNDDADNRETLVSAPTDAVQPRPNNAATGAPAITGTVQVGETLGVDTSAISDPDGMENVTFYYQWFAGDPAIQETTESSYTLTDADEGKTIQVRVSFTDDAGNPETLTSPPTGAAVPREPPPAPENLTATVNPDGSVTLTWDNPQDDSITGYQVLRRRPQEGEDRLLVHVENTGNTGTSYTDTDVTPGVRHVYRVKAINGAGLSQRSNYVRVTP